MPTPNQVVNAYRQIDDLIDQETPLPLRPNRTPLVMGMDTYRGDGISYDLSTAGAIAGGRFDYIDGAGGDDVLRGENLSDIVVGGDGNDMLYGGIGGLAGGVDARDFVFGDEAPVVTILGGIKLISLPPLDFTFGATHRGNDIIQGNRGGDYLFGGAGNDTIYGGSIPVGGLPTVTNIANSGNDFIAGGPGDDWLFGDTGDDIIHGNMVDDASGRGLFNAYYFSPASPTSGSKTHDVAYFTGSSPISAADYTLTEMTSGYYKINDNRLIANNDGIDLIAGVDQLYFAGSSDSISLGYQDKEIGVRQHSQPNNNMLAENMAPQAQNFYSLEAGQTIVTTITYSFVETETALAYDYFGYINSLSSGGKSTSWARSLSDDERNAVKTILGQIEALTNIDFTEALEPGGSGQPSLIPGADAVGQMRFMAVNDPLNGQNNKGYVASGIYPGVSICK